ncbi:MAG TPA: glycosyltransferase [Candidatus Limnocylindrales bacterium]|nr:glycosyltransferase [Candidatus Limnocylindrales bacterium]
MMLKKRVIKRPVVYTQRRVRWTHFHADTTIVVPVMNEADNIMPLVARVQAALRGHKAEILFIDDSRDTISVERAALARVLYRTDSFDVKLLHRVGEKRWGGLSGAVIDGFNVAKSDRIVVMDGDLQHPPETLPVMIAASKKYDMVVASRYRKGGSAAGLDGGIRHLVSRGSTLLAKVFFPWRLRKVSDPMTGFFLLDRRKLDVSRLRPKGFKILLEILATHPKLAVTEVPLQFAERLAGESHGTLKQGLEFFSQLLSLRFSLVVKLINRLPKFVVFSMIGGSVFVFGMVLLYGLVELGGWAPTTANALQLVVTFWLNYVLNRNITWRHRSVSRMAIYKFLASRAATTVVNYVLFAWLITLSITLQLAGNTWQFSINYLLANILSLAAIMVLNYAVSDRWAFAETTPETASNPTSTSKRRTLLTRIGLAIATVPVLIGLMSMPPVQAFTIILAAVGLALFLQASIEVWRIIYIFREPEAVDRLRFPTPRTEGPYEKFCLIVPARHEAEVLDATLLQLAKQTHPDVSIISIICDDDFETLRVAYTAAEQNSSIEVMDYPLDPDTKPNKPLQLNYVLDQVKDRGYSVIGIVDAEDTVHPELVAHVDAAFRDPEIGIVQGGVQLMNHDSSWYALHNVLEYYRWFNSAMAFQADSQFMPLGGNTIFLRASLLYEAGGWPVTLTEDCSLGVLLSTRHQTKTAVYYEPRLATREETPDTLKGLFKQRVRWNQGFFHEWRAGIWRELPSFQQRLLAGYVLLGPVLLAAISVFMLISLASVFFLKAPVALVMLMYLPMIPVCLLFILNAIFLHDFGKAFGRKVTLWQYVVLFATQIPYQIVLNTAALWSVVRELRGDTSWHKTAHSGQHRADLDLDLELQPVPVYIGRSDG